MKFEFHFDHEQSQRLDHFLTALLPDFTRTMIQKSIEAGGATVNAVVRKKTGFALKQGDQVAFVLTLTTPDLGKPEFIELDIVDEQPDFLIINKPAGLIVHQALSSGEQISLVNGLLFHFAEFKQFDDKQRPGIVHRLDKNTSGLIIVARNPQAQAHLSTLFKDRKIHKTYLAVINGHPDRKGTIEYPIGRDKIRRYKMSHRGIAPRDARTDFEVIEYFEDSTLVKAMPVTGRTHQIRVHFSALNHYILGDQIYGQPSKMIKRQALHAHKLSFEYQGKQYDYSIDMPEDMELLVNRLRKSTSKIS